MRSNEKPLQCRMRRNGYVHRTPGEREWQFAAQNGRCYYCRVSMSKTRTIKKVVNGKKVNVPNPVFATWDHIIPVCKGGSEDLSNRVLACHKCNFEKGHNDSFVPQRIH